MRQGDFTKLAKLYVNRPGYSTRVIRTLAAYIGAYRDGFSVADVGAGTGKLTEILIQQGFSGYAVEPNDAMREEGICSLGSNKQFQWFKGTAEETTLPDSCVDWVFMASSFHWADTELALKEFRRILKPGGFFTALWNPRDITRSSLEQKIEGIIADIVPELNRVSSGSGKFTQDLGYKLQMTNDFENLLFIEAEHEVFMDHERYLGVWNSVNDIQAQAGPERFGQIMNAIREEIKNMDSISVPYKTRAWTVQVKKG